MITKTVYVVSLVCAYICKHVLKSWWSIIEFTTVCTYVYIYILRTTEAAIIIYVGEKWTVGGANRKT